MRFCRKHEAIKAPLYVFSQKTAFRIHVLTNSWTFTVKLVQSFLELFMTPLQFMEFSKFFGFFRIACLVHHCFKHGDTNALGFDVQCQR